MLLVLKHEGKRPFGRSIREWEDNIEINFKEFYIHGSVHRDSILIRSNELQ